MVMCEAVHLWPLVAWNQLTKGTRRWYLAVLLVLGVVRILSISVTITVAGRQEPDIIDEDFVTSLEDDDVMFLVNSKPQGPETGQEILDEQSHLQSEFENLSEPVDNRYNNIILDDEKARASTKRQKTRKSPPENMVLSESQVLSSDEMLKAEEDFALRRKRMRGTCVKYGLGKYRARGSADSNFRYPPSANYDVLYIDRQDGLTYCPVYKAASTSWLHNLCVLAGADPHWLNNKTLHISTVARRFWPQLEYDVAASVVPATLRFMIVRHPFDRLISAYRDKLENINVGREHGVLHFHESYGKKIVHKYRLPNSTVQQVRLHEEAHLPKPAGVEPTFQEFVRYLIDIDLALYADDHWMPYYLFCSSCYIDYDVIAHFDSLQRDQMYILHKLKLETKIKPSWRHLTKGKKTEALREIYMKTLSERERKMLFDKYRIDFEMFGFQNSH